jgi:hypothetical protein
MVTRLGDGRRKALRGGDGSGDRKLLALFIVLTSTIGRKSLFGRWLPIQGPINRKIRAEIEEANKGATKTKAANFEI